VPLSKSIEDAFAMTGAAATEDTRWRLCRAAGQRQAAGPFPRDLARHAGECAEIRFEPDGRVALVLDTRSNGQGRETSSAQTLVDPLTSDLVL
jgi:CO/xanthine dehydrogenase Mo-binding subunit